MSGSSQGQNYGSTPPSVPDYTGQGLGLQRAGLPGAAPGGMNSHLSDLMTLLGGGGMGGLLNNRMGQLQGLAGMLGQGGPYSRLPGGGGAPAGGFAGGLTPQMPQPSQFGVGAIPTEQANIARYDIGRIPSESVPIQQGGMGGLRGTGIPASVGGGSFGDSAGTNIGTILARILGSVA